MGYRNDGQSQTGRSHDQTMDGPFWQVWEKMPDRVDVLMTHGPAHCAQTKTETETRAAEIARGFSD